MPFISASRWLTVVIAKGCERAFVVDNHSLDDTLARAMAAGADVARVYHAKRR